MIRLSELKLPLADVPAEHRRASDAPSETDEDRIPPPHPVEALSRLAAQALGIAVSMVLVHVVNPQSFHWTMDLLLPWPRLAALCASVVVAGTLTALVAGRTAVGRDAVLAVKEDW